MTPSVPLMILPMCMYLARNLGGRGGGPARGPARSSKAGAGQAGSDSLAMDGVMSSRSRSRSHRNVSHRNVSAQKQKFSAMFWSRGRFLASRDSISHLLAWSCRDVVDGADRCLAEKVQRRDTITRSLVSRDACARTINFIRLITGRRREKLENTNTVCFTETSLQTKLTRKTQTSWKIPALHDGKFCQQKHAKSLSIQQYRVPN